MRNAKENKWMPEIPTYIMDSYAMLALFEGESGADQVQGCLNDAATKKAQVLMSQINLGEVLYIIERERGFSKAQQALAAIEQLPIELLEVTRERILQAAYIKANMRLSYADAFAVAAAAEFSGSILTGDPEFAEIEKEISVTWLPQKGTF